VRLCTVEELRTIRRKLEASQSKFGKMIGADQALVSIWETGRGKPGPQYTAKIAALLRERGIERETLLAA
jgi:DNA-binding transcriptional regulator YiaG